jgi:hypothetical protein
MKKIAASLALLLTGLTVNAQVGIPNSNANNQWKLNGNNSSPNDFVGSTNSNSLVFKTNSVERLRVDGSTGQFLVKNDMNVFGNVTLNQKLEVLGNAHLLGNVQLDNTLNFNGAFGMKYIAANGAGNNYFVLGNLTNGQLPAVPLSTCAAQANSALYMAIPAMFQSFDNNNSGLVTWGWDGANGIIETESPNANAKLLLNYWCGKDVYICTGANKGTLYANVTHLGSLKPLAGTAHQDAMLTVDGKIVAKACYVTAMNWADFVFDKDYKLMPLAELEAYYTTNKHLPGVPTEAEVKENGVGVSEMTTTLLQKVEELTLYMVELKKENEARKKENEDLKKKLDELKK